MSHIQRACVWRVVVSLALTMSVCSHGLAEEHPLIMIGPRIGISGSSPLLGKEQRYNFRLYDIAAFWRLPWRWPLGETAWSLETRLITSAGAIAGGGDTGFVATVVPDLALTGWNGLVTLDVGLGAGLFPKYKFGAQTFGGPVQIVGTVGIGFNVFPHTYAGFRLQHFSDATLYGSSSLGADMYILELAYRF
jgi:Lipid A 3-O-deacylase (PagL)